MNTTRSILFVIAVIASFLAHQALGARGGGASHGGGGGGHAAGGAAHGGGAVHTGGGARQSFGHAPTFSTPHVSRTPEFHTTPHTAVVRPNIGTRPNIETRPNIGTRPALENRPEFTNRPAIENRPNVVARPNFENRPQNVHDFFNRPGIGEHSTLGVRPSYVSHPDYFNRPGVVNRPGIVARPGTIGRNPLVGSWYHGDWHNWGNRPWYGRPAWWWGNNWWGAGYLPGYAAWQIPWSWGYWSYYNPYYTQPLTFGATTVNYSQPIVMATPAAGVDQTSAEDQAMQFFDSARDAFMNGEYQQALTQVDNAIGLLPNDAVLHEFRGLVLFALGDYKQAAASVYAALSVGPGWDWTTLSGFYPNTDVYTQQLRALEQYASQNPNQSDARFLLAYQYLTCGYTDQAIGQLQEVVQLNPKDQLSAQLLASLTGPQQSTSPSPGNPGAVNPGAVNPGAVNPGAVNPGAVPPPLAGPTEPPASTAPSVPVSAAALTGRWTATRPDGSTVTLNLSNDSKYDWNYTANGQAHNFAGTFSVADNLLILKQGDTPAMVGQVTLINNRQFNFKMPGDNPNDPGLTFNRS